MKKNTISWLELLLLLSLSGCAVNSPTLNPPTEWGKYEAIVGGAKVAYQLPKGDEYSPAPHHEIRLDKHDALGHDPLGGVVFGARPQGRELANVLFRVSIIDFKAAADHPLSAEELQQKLNEEHHQPAANLRQDKGVLTRLADSEIVKMESGTWVHMRLVDAENGLPWGESYSQYFDNKHYLFVQSLLWSTASKNQDFVLESTAVVRRIAASVKIQATN